MNSVSGERDEAGGLGRAGHLHHGLGADQIGAGLDQVRGQSERKEHGGNVAAV